jgi:ABC-2 type transport system ATP-binding protein
VATGTVEEILSGITPHPRIVVKVRERAEEALRVLRKTPFVLDATADGNDVTVECRESDPDVPELVRRLVECGVPILSVRRSEADLEDLFLKITEGKVQ